MARGVLISLDGVDGAGKTTQCELLAGWLRDREYPVVTCRDPGSTPLGEAVRRLLLDPGTGPISRRAEMLLYMASRAQLVAEVIRPALESGQVVICDRFVLANVVYQGYAGGLAVDELWRIGEVATAGVMPDVTVVLDLEPDRAAERLQRPRDRMESNSAEFHRQVREGFLAAARESGRPIRVVNAAGSVQQVQEQIRQEVLRHLGDRLPGGVSPTAPVP